MAEEQIRELRFLPKQWDFLISDAKELLYSGAFGAGKSVTLCTAALRKAVISHNRVGLGRKTLKALKQSTRVTLLEGDGILDPILPKGFYHYHKTDNEIKIRGGGTIVLFGIDCPETLGSWPFGSIYIDQIEELNEDEYLMLLGRCRMPVDPVRQLGGACNPASPEHFLARRYGINGKALPGTQLIQTCSADNRFLPKDYLKQLETLTGTHYARYVEGKWVGFEGLVYDEWSREHHVKRFEKPPQYEQIVAGLDQGFTDPSVRLSVGVYRIGNDLALHVFDEYYQRNVAPSDFVDYCRIRSAEERTMLSFVDPSAAGLIADLNIAGVAATAGDNAILDGIRAVKSFLRVRPDGRPRLTVDPRCGGVLGEITAYIWQKGKDKPVDRSNHALDALRYVCTHFGTGFAEPRIYMLGKQDKEKECDKNRLTFRDVYGEKEEPASVTAEGDFGWTET